jgi:hypothetical protein
MATTALGLALQISASTAGLAKGVNDVNAKLDSMAEAGKKSAKDLAILKTIEISRALIDGVALPCCRCLIKVPKLSRHNVKRLKLLALC